ncbi:TPA: hypothetical protein NJ211_004663 [Vibrio parahaemolyticus]|nr:hypothetical protein [Vibrio parahaemolyticus]HCG6702064.1 hypothetical protein [Vibrio parahaemolyticus]HCG6712578.1 hypothetical protein [Vibrio parahaemolyticus]
MFDSLKSTFPWSIIAIVAVSGSGVVGAKLYKEYLKTTGPAVVQGISDNEAYKDFVDCLTVVDLERSSLMEKCDSFYLEYLPAKTDPSYKKKIIEVQQLKPEWIEQTYQKLTWLRSDYGLPDWGFAPISAKSPM